MTRAVKALAITGGIIAQNERIEANLKTRVIRPPGILQGIGLASRRKALTSVPLSPLYRGRLLPVRHLEGNE